MQPLQPVCTWLTLGLGVTLVVVMLIQAGLPMNAPQLLTDPFLQLPTASSVRVVWFTEFAGTLHTVAYGTDLEQTATAATRQLSRSREDAKSQTVQPYAQVTDRPIWRHEAEVTGLTPDRRVPYHVLSVREDGARVQSAVFTLAPKPPPGRPLKILLTSDHQLKPLVSANLQKVVETVDHIDLVLFAGDLVNVPDRASEWFDDTRGGAFFPALQGRATYELDKAGVKTRYRGGEIIQHAPMYTTIGNHEVMGRFSSETSLHDQFGDAFPRALIENRYPGTPASFADRGTSTPDSSDAPALRETWIKNHSFNTDTYEEILTLPESPKGGERYYAVTFGDIRLIVLYITNIWRTPSLAADARSKYREREADLQDSDRWGWGQFIFEPVDRDSTQYAWLKQELHHPEFQHAKYKVVMFHHPPHSLGENSVPAYTTPRQLVERQGTRVISVRYEYPKADNYIIRDVVPLLESAGVQCVVYGHSHLWNRFVSPNGMHFLETSNVGNSYGACVGTPPRSSPTGYQEDDAATGDPHRLAPVTPTIAPLLDANHQPLPYLASNDLTAFSIFDTGTGSIRSYYYDTRQPNSPVVLFDEFSLT